MGRVTKIGRRVCALVALVGCLWGCSEESRIHDLVAQVEYYPGGDHIITPAEEELVRIGRPAVPAIVKLVGQADPLVRLIAHRILRSVAASDREGVPGSALYSEVYDTLRKRLALEEDEIVLIALLRGLPMFGGLQGFLQLGEILGNHSEEVRRNAAVVVWDISGVPRGIDVLALIRAGNDLEEVIEQQRQWFKENRGRLVLGKRREGNTWRIDVGLR